MNRLLQNIGEEPFRSCKYHITIIMSVGLDEGDFKFYYTSTSAENSWAVPEGRGPGNSKMTLIPFFQPGEIGFPCACCWGSNCTPSIHTEPSTWRGHGQNVPVAVWPPFTAEHHQLFLLSHRSSWQSPPPSRVPRWPCGSLAEAHESQKCSRESGQSYCCFFSSHKDK